MNRIEALEALFGGSGPSVLRQRAANLRLLSEAQFRQDMFVLEALNYKRGGFFVDVGAADGLQVSNTHLLDHTFDWRGICVEPAKGWHVALLKNRPSVYIDHRCVWSTDGIELDFLEPQCGLIAAVECRADEDHLGRIRHAGTSAIYKVATVSLLRLLQDYEAPGEIDYLSLDTEGCEPAILKAFERDNGFDRYRFQVITCEHNHNPANRTATRAVLERNGYIRVLESVSDIEDWYLHRALC